MTRTGPSRRKDPRAKQTVGDSRGRRPRIDGYLLLEAQHRYTANAQRRCAPITIVVPLIMMAWTWRSRCPGTADRDAWITQYTRSRREKDTRVNVEVVELRTLTPDHGARV